MLWPISRGIMRGNWARRFCRARERRRNRRRSREIWEYSLEKAPEWLSLVAQLRRNPMRLQVTLIAALISLGLGISICNADGVRTAKQIETDLEAVTAPNYPMWTQVDPRYRRQMKNEMAGPI